MADVEFGRMSIKESKEDIKASPARPHWFEQYVQPCMGELVGSAFFIFMGCVSVIENADGTSRLQPALVHGLALGLTIAVLGSISGGHFNPAVSLGAWLIGGLNMVMVIPYWISQLCGGLIGAAFAKRGSLHDHHVGRPPGEGFDQRGHHDHVPRPHRVHGGHQREDQEPPGPLLHWLHCDRGYPRRGCYLRGLHEPSPSVWPRAGCQLLGLPLGVLGGPHGGRTAGRSLDQVPDWRQENSPLPQIAPPPPSQLGSPSNGGLLCLTRALSLWLPLLLLLPSLPATPG
ncbi:aquaporin-8 isoform X1 [Sphaerodactylus townsendi]|uniref:aquaporin-8 isoform X1 n=1 Tax=Sphaerodactylus townsendi TaxID=933632 RepID=UPI002025FF61|nr:aquaporin-8 isoform X1 [Sphaerodactylus townsendi]